MIWSSLSKKGKLRHFNEYIKYMDKPHKKTPKEIKSIKLKISNKKPKLIIKRHKHFDSIDIEEELKESHKEEAKHMSLLLIN